MPSEEASALPPVAPIEVRISMTKSLWFDLIFVVGTQGRIVETSTTEWNIGELRTWLGGIIRQSPCPILEIDREGVIDCVEARHVDDERVHLRIFDYFERDVIYIDAVVSRKKLVWEIYYELKMLSKYIENFYIPQSDSGAPAWLALDDVEKWLDWPRHSGPFSMRDTVSGVCRAGEDL